VASPSAQPREFRRRAGKAVLAALEAATEGLSLADLHSLTGVSRSRLLDILSAGERAGYMESRQAPSGGKQGRPPTLWWRTLKPLDG